MHTFASCSMIWVSCRCMVNLSSSFCVSKSFTSHVTSASSETTLASPASIRRSSSSRLRYDLHSNRFKWKWSSRVPSLEMAEVDDCASSSGASGSPAGAYQQWGSGWVVGVAKCSTHLFNTHSTSRNPLRAFHTHQLETLTCTASNATWAISSSGPASTGIFGSTWTAASPSPAATAASCSSCCSSRTQRAIGR